MWTVSRFIRTGALAGLGLTATLGTASATAFNGGPENESTTSLGIFAINVDAGFQAAVQSMVSGGQLPGFTYNSTNHRLYSPLLNDANTQINISASYQRSGGSWPTSVTIGTGGNADTINPNATPGTVPTAFQNPANGSWAVSTKVQSFDLSNGNTHVRAGAAATNATGASYGQVQSPNNSFPAQSFFDIFVDVLLPNGAVLANPSNSPLVVENPTLTDFPPHVVYIHGTSGAAALDFVGGTFNGQQIGTITLAGHGAGYGGPAGTVTPQEQQRFLQDFANTEAANGTPLTSADFAGFGIPEPGSLLLVSAGLGGLMLLRRRPRPRQG